MQFDYIKALKICTKLGFFIESHEDDFDGYPRLIHMRHRENFNSVSLIVRSKEVKLYYYNGFKDNPVGYYEPDFKKFVKRLAKGK